MDTFSSIVLLNACPRRALGTHEWIKKSSRTQKRTQTHHCRKVIEGPAGTQTGRILKESPLGPIIANEHN
jgi:hypothetical protein